MRFLRFFRIFRAWRSFADAIRLARHPAVPLHLKIVAGVLALVIVSPLNILGDIPLLGMLDDVALLALLAGWFARAAAPYAAAETLEAEPAEFVERRSWLRSRPPAPML